MEWQSVSLSSGYDPTWYDSQEYYDVGSSYQFGSLAHSQTPSYPSEVSDWTSKTSSPLDSLSLCPSQMTPPNFLRNMSNMSSCIGLGYVENRHLTCVETSESGQTSETLPIERQDPKPPRAANALSLLKRSLVSTETGSSEQTSSSKGKNPRRCTQCQIRRKKCQGLANPDDPRCLRCFQQKLPITLCFRQSVTEFQPFEKWNNEVYESLFTAVQTQEMSQSTATFRHYVQGPSLQVVCCPFEPTWKHQVRALKKDASGWHSVATTAYCVKDRTIDIGSYINECIPHTLNEICESTSAVSVFFRVARVHSDNSLIRDCLKLYTCLRLLFIGWQIHGCENLGMTTIQDSQSPWNGITPVPRMIQNQLGHLLELQMIKLDKKILLALRKALQTRNRSSWIFTSLAFFILLHVRELDGARNIFWGRYKDSGGFWIHPSKPSSLIEEQVASCSSLLASYHSVIGSTPLTMNWDSQKSKDLLENDEIAITSMKVLQSYVLALRDNQLIGRKASDLYRDGEPLSVQLTISSLMFVNGEKGAEVKNFS